MKILVINSGSSSIKFQLIQMPQKTVVASGLVERIGLEDSAIHYKTENNEVSKTVSILHHSKGLEEISKMLMDSDIGVIKDRRDIAAVGHRVVHGGADFSNTIVIDDKVKQKIRDLFSLAPLHNPPNLNGIEVAEQIFVEAEQIAVFDTAFHQTLPEKVYRYAIPKELSENEKIRVYGFHGISHQYVSKQAVKFLDNPEAKIITIHLGNGCSMTAVHQGKSKDHSLGFGPNEGLIMGTRSGAIDSSVVLFLMEKMEMTQSQVANLLMKNSGMLGLTGMSDLRDIEDKASQGNEVCNLALQMNAYRIKKLIGAYAAAMNGLDALVFTAGIGENSQVIRELVCEDMDFMGILLDREKNAIRSKKNRAIHLPESKVNVLVVPTNEELEIAEECYALLK